MKELRENMKRVGILVLILFIGLCVWFGMTAYTQGSIWASDVHNTRLSATTVLRGDITDRNGITLATNAEDGSREYVSDEEARRALSQVVGDTAGMSGTGVEAFYSSSLLEISNSSLFERVRQLSSGGSRVGSSVQMTIDANLQVWISRQFPEGYDGAVCVMNWKTGEILAMVSKPDYDPYAVLDRSDAETEEGAYMNRCLQGLYTPGSVFKIVTLSAALNADRSVVNKTFTCSGDWEYDGGNVNCAKNTAHGELNLRKAFMKSCNVTYGKLAYQLGSERLCEMAERFGFNENFKFGDFVIYNSSCPLEDVDDAQLIWSGIGQGKVLVTPLHMTMIASTVANGGKMMEPWLIQRVVTSLGIPTQVGSAQLYREVLDEDIASTVAEYMYETVQSGTAVNAAVDGLVICGKTGSAEVSDDKSVATNAWFTGFIYDSETPYAVSVVVEGGGAGGDLSSKLAGKIFAHLAG